MADAHPVPTIESVALDYFDWAATMSMPLPDNLGLKASRRRARMRSQLYRFPCLRSGSCRRSRGGIRHTAEWLTEISRAIYAAAHPGFW
jgi:hypothetical protein